MNRKTKYKRLFTVLLVCLLAFTVVLPMQASAKSKTALNKKKIVLVKGMKYKALKLKNAPAKVTWRSSKKSIASVSKSGVITPKKSGTCKITATSKGKKYTCSVRVISARVSTTSLNMKVGESRAIGISYGKAADKKYGSPSFSVSSSVFPAPVSVAKNGTVTANTNGTATIYVTIGESEFPVKVTVSKAGAQPTSKPTSPTSKPTVAPTDKPGKVTVTPESIQEAWTGSSVTYTVKDAEEFGAAITSLDGKFFASVSQGTNSVTVSCKNRGRVTVTIGGVDTDGNSIQIQREIVIKDKAFEDAYAEWKSLKAQVIALKNSGGIGNMSSDLIEPAFYSIEAFYGADEYNYITHSYYITTETLLEYNARIKEGLKEAQALNTLVYSPQATKIVQDYIDNYRTTHTLTYDRFTTDSYKGAIITQVAAGSDGTKPKFVWSDNVSEACRIQAGYNILRWRSYAQSGTSTTETNNGLWANLSDMEGRGTGIGLRTGYDNNGDSWVDMEDIGGYETWIKQSVNSQLGSLVVKFNAVKVMSDNKYAGCAVYTGEWKKGIRTVIIFTSSPTDSKTWSGATASGGYSMKAWDGPVTQDEVRKILNCDEIY